MLMYRLLFCRLALCASSRRSTTKYHRPCASSCGQGSIRAPKTWSSLSSHNKQKEIFLITCHSCFLVCFLCSICFFHQLPNSLCWVGRAYSIWRHSLDRRLFCAARFPRASLPLLAGLCVATLPPTPPPTRAPSQTSTCVFQQWFFFSCVLTTNSF